MKSICFVTPSLQKGGMERVLSELSNSLVIKGYEVFIICLIRIDNAYEINGKVKIIGPDTKYSKGFFNKVKTFKFLYSTIKMINPSVLISFSEVFNPLSIIVGKLTRVKIFISDRSNPLMTHTKRDQITRKITYPFADGIIAQTSLAKKVFLEKSYNSNISIIPNPLKVIKNISLNYEKKAIVNVGRLVDSKNQKELIEIFNRINNPEWTLYIIGGGNNFESLNDYVNKLNLRNQIVFSGEVMNVDEWLNKGSIFAYTSLTEGFPNALNEAMAYPLASIAFNCQAGVSDLIENGLNGYLIDMGDSLNYEKKLVKLMNDAKLRKTFMEASINNREKFNTNNISDQIIDFVLS